MRLAIHDAGLLTAEQRAAQFTARERLLADLVTAAGGAPADRTAQHRLVVGPSGIGKTMLLTRIADETGGIYCSVRTGLADPAELWRTAVRATGNEVDPDADPLAQLLDVCGRDNRTVLCVDGFDRVLEALGNDAWELRDALSRETAITMIGSAEELPESTYKYDGAFFDYFATHRLDPLGIEAGQAFLQHVAEAIGESRIARGLAADPGRSRALAVLTTGNPRALVLALEALVVQGPDSDAMACIDHVCDRLTAAYEQRFEAVSPQARVVLGALARHWHPAHAKTIAATLGQPTNRVSTYVDRLSRDGFVDKVPMPPGKTNGYQLHDRLCNVWFLLRDASDSRARVEALARFAAGADPELAVLRAGLDDDAPGEWHAVELRGLGLG